MTALIHGAEPPDVGKVSSWLHDWKVDVVSDRIPLDLGGLKDIEGLLVGNLHVAGDGSDIHDISGEISISDGKVAKVTLDRARVAIEQEKGDIRTMIDLGFGGEGALLARASANQKALLADPTTAPFRLDVEKGTIPMAFIAGILHPAITKGDGTLTIEGSVAGTAKDPKGDLTLRVENGSVDVPATGVNYGEIDLLAKLEGTVLTVDHANVSSSPRYLVKKIFSGKEEGHTAHLSGRIDLAGGTLGEAKLELELREFWVASITELLLSASGNLAVEGSWPALTVNGSVDIDEGRLKLDKHQFIPKASTQPHPDIVFTEPRPQFAEAPEDEEDQGPSLLDELDANVRINLRRRMTFQATMPLSTDPGSPADLAEAKASGRLDGSLKVGIHQGEMSVGGSIETVEAQANLLGAQFDVKEGNIAFASADYKEPNLNFELVREVKEYGTVTALVSGTPTALSIDSITSDQYSDQADVLSLLLFGKPQSEMGSGDNNAAVEAAAALVGGQVAKGLGGAGVTASYDATSGLSAGVSLSRDLFLAFLYNPTSEEDENRTGVKLSYFIGNRTQADLETGDAGASSGWLYWKMRF
jgi:autotransporter translocation and assembly factor TamB